MTLRLPRFGITTAVLSLTALTLLPNCSDSKEGAYTPRPAYSGRPISLPAVPTLSQKPKKAGDAYTVWGAIHDLRSRIHGPQLTDKEITVVGYITKTNLPDAPPCAVHKEGKKDGKECETTPPPVPSFWIGDDKGASEKDSIQVLGWARNFAVVYDAIEKYKSHNVKDPVKDDQWGVEVPNPVPAKDAKVKVTGTYSTTFTKASQGAESNPMTGIITFKSIAYLEPPPEHATLLGMR